VCIVISIKLLRNRISATLVHRCDVRLHLALMRPAMPRHFSHIIQTI